MAAFPRRKTQFTPIRIAQSPVIVFSLSGGDSAEPSGGEVYGVGFVADEGVRLDRRVSRL
jgi:hypothetical protein